jgi:hypothetical protein
MASPTSTTPDSTMTTQTPTDSATPTTKKSKKRPM